MPAPPAFRMFAGGGLLIGAIVFGCSTFDAGPDTGAPADAGMGPETSADASPSSISDATNDGPSVAPTRFCQGVQAPVCLDFDDGDLDGGGGWIANFSATGMFGLAPNGASPPFAMLARSFDASPGSTAEATGALVARYVPVGPNGIRIDLDVDFRSHASADTVTTVLRVLNEDDSGVAFGAGLNGALLIGFLADGGSLAEKHSPGIPPGWRHVTINYARAGFVGLEVDQLTIASGQPAPKLGDAVRVDVGALTLPTGDAVVALDNIVLRPL